MKLSEKKRKTKFRITGITMTRCKEGKVISIITLKTPIPRVIGSDRMIESRDVKDLWIYEDAAHIVKLNGKQTKMHIYDLHLDVARNGNVWVVKKRFAEELRDMRKKYDRQQWRGID